MQPPDDTILAGHPNGDRIATFMFYVSVFILLNLFDLKTNILEN